MEDQAPRVADIREVREEAHPLDQLDARLEAAFDAEGEHRARALGQVLLRQRVMGAGLQGPRRTPRRPSDAGSGIRRPCSAFATCRSIRTCKRLDAGDREERVHRRERRAEIAQRHRAGLDGEGEIAEILEELEPVIGGLGLGQRRKAFALRPVELARIRPRCRPANCRGPRGTWSSNARRCRRRTRSAGRGRASPAYCRRSAAGPPRARPSPPPRCRRRRRRDWRGSR